MTTLPQPYLARRAVALCVVALLAPPSLAAPAIDPDLETSIPEAETDAHIPVLKSAVYASAASSVIVGAALPVAVVATTLPHVIVPLVGQYEVARWVGWTMVPPVLGGVTGMSLSSIAITSLLVAVAVTTTAAVTGGVAAATAALLGSVPGLIQSVGGTALVAFSAYMYWGAAFYGWAAPISAGQTYVAIAPQAQLTPLSAATLSVGVLLCITAPAVTAAGAIGGSAVTTAVENAE